MPFEHAHVQGELVEMIITSYGVASATLTVRSYFEQYFLARSAHTNSASLPDRDRGSNITVIIKVHLESMLAYR